MRRELLLVVLALEMQRADGSELFTGGGQCRRVEVLYWNITEGGTVDDYLISGSRAAISDATRQIITGKKSQ